MKTIGLIGGVSWESSAEYYRLINQEIKTSLGSEHSAEIMMYSMDFQPVAQLEHEGKWDDLTELLVDGVRRLENAGADFVLVASNTLHKVTDEVQRRISVPLLHIADAAADEIGAAGVSLVGLLGTRFVMEEDFYKKKLSARGLKVLIPERASRDSVHDIIYNELCLGHVLEVSRERILKIMTELEEAGAEAIVLANTELPLLIRTTDSHVKLFDTMAIHTRRAVSLALATGQLRQA
jgi:aspartate racemase